MEHIYYTELEQMGIEVQIGNKVYWIRPAQNTLATHGVTVMWRKIDSAGWVYAKGKQRTLALDALARRPKS